MSPLSAIGASAFFAALVVAASGLEAATLTVGNSGADYTSIQPALDAAQPDDTVLVKPGTYAIEKALTFGGKAVALRSQSGPTVTKIAMASTSIDPRASFLAFEGDAGETPSVEGFTLRDGKGIGGVGGAVFCSGSSSPTLIGCVITGNGKRDR